MSDASDATRPGFTDHGRPVLGREQVAGLPGANRPGRLADEGSEFRVAEFGDDIGEVRHDRCNLHIADRNARGPFSDLQNDLLHKAGVSSEATKHDRLKQVRSKRYGTAKDAATALGVPYGTYSGHEAGTRGFDNDEAGRYARFFRVSASWLVFGEEGRAVPSVIPLLGIVGAGGTIATESEQPDPSIEICVELAVSMPRATSAYVVEGTSMLPFFRPGTVIVCGPELTDPSGLYGDEVAVCDVNGNRFLKILHEGSRDGTFDLQSHNADLMRDVVLRWIAEIIAIIPAKQWKRVERDIGVRTSLRAAE